MVLAPQNSLLAFCRPGEASAEALRGGATALCASLAGDLDAMRRPDRHGAPDGNRFDVMEAPMVARASQFHGRGEHPDIGILSPSHAGGRPHRTAVDC